MISSRYIADQINIRNDYVDDNILQILEDLRHMSDKEYALLSQNTFSCPLEERSIFEDNTSSIDLDRLKTMMDERFMDPEVMKAISCSVGSIFFSLKRNKKNIMRTSRVKEYVKKLTKIGEESAEGYAMTSSFGMMNDMFVIKVSKTDDEDLLHEAFVGIFGTNKLREFIPNFAYIYGAFKCSLPIFDEEGNVLTWCDSKSGNRVPYVLYENIDNAVTMREFIATATKKEFLNAFLQVVLASKLANDKIGYTHYDLHTLNVMVRNISNFVNIKYYDIKLRCNFISTIIDYGFTRIVYKEMSYGNRNPGLYPYFIYSDKDHIMHDMYKFLLFSSADCLNSKNNQCYDICSVLYEFFPKSDDLSYSILKEREYYYSYPDTNLKESGITIDNFISYILNHFGEYLDIVPESKEYLRDSNFMELSNLLNVSKLPRANNFFDLYDFYHHHDGMEFLTIKDQFIPLYQQEKLKYRTKVTRLFEKMKHVKVYQFPLARVDLYETNTFKKIRELYHNAFRKKEIIEQLNNELNVGSFVAFHFVDSNLSKLILKMAKEVKVEDVRLSHVVGSYAKDYTNYIQHIPHNELIDNKGLEWYFTHAADILNLDTKTSKSLKVLDKVTDRDRKIDSILKSQNKLVVVEEDKNGSYRLSRI